MQIGVAGRGVNKFRFGRVIFVYLWNIQQKYIEYISLEFGRDVENNRK